MVNKDRIDLKTLSLQSLVTFYFILRSFYERKQRASCRCKSLSLFCNTNISSFGKPICFSFFAKGCNILYDN